MATYDPRGGGEVTIADEGVAATARSKINFHEGGGIQIDVADDSVNAETDVTLTVTGSGGPPSGAAGGDLAGTYPNPTIGTNKVTGAKFRQSAARSLVANPTNALADVADLAGGGAGTVFQDTGSALVAQALARIIQNLSLEGDVTPAQLAANTDNWNPKATASVVRFSTDANGREIRGLVPSTNDGDIAVLINVGSNTGVIKNEQGTSTATNRFVTPDCTLGANEAALLYHDPNEDTGTGRWRVLLKFLTLGTAAHQACAGNDSRLSDSRAPNGAAGGDLTGTYPNPTIGANKVVTAAILDDNVTLAKLVEIAALTVLVNATNGTANPTALSFGTDGFVLKRNGTVLDTGLITDANVAAANKDGAAGTASMRTLGTTSVKACAGDDARLSDSRAPSGAAGGDLAGTYPNPTIGTNKVTNGKFRQGAALSVVGVTGNATADVADIAAGTDGDILRRKGTAVAFGRALPVVVTLTDAATISVDASLIGIGDSFTVTLGGNRTVGAPSNPTNGQWMCIAVVQDGTGSRTLAFTTGAAGFRATELSLTQTLSTAAGKIDYFLFRYHSGDNRWDLMDFRKAA